MAHGDRSPETPRTTQPQGDDGNDGNDVALDNSLLLLNCCLAADDGHDTVSRNGNLVYPSGARSCTNTTILGCSLKLRTAPCTRRSRLTFSYHSLLALCPLASRHRIQRIQDRFHDCTNDNNLSAHALYGNGYGSYQRPGGRRLEVY